MTHVVTVWLTSPTGPVRATFEAAHVRVAPLHDGWHELVLMDDDWEVLGVEQFRGAHRVSVKRIKGGGDE